MEALYLIKKSKAKAIFTIATKKCIIKYEARKDEIKYSDGRTRNTTKYRQYC